MGMKLDDDAPEVSYGRIIIGRCVRKGQPIICTGLCNTVSCPFPIWLALGMTEEEYEKAFKDKRKPLQAQNK